MNKLQATATIARDLDTARAYLQRAASLAHLLAESDGSVGTAILADLVNEALDGLRPAREGTELEASIPAPTA